MATMCVAAQDPASTASHGFSAAPQMIPSVSAPTPATGVVIRLRIPLSRMRTSATAHNRPSPAPPANSPPPPQPDRQTPESSSSFSSASQNEKEKVADAKAFEKEKKGGTIFRCRLKPKGREEEKGGTVTGTSTQCGGEASSSSGRIPQPQEKKPRTVPDYNAQPRKSQRPRTVPDYRTLSDSGMPATSTLPLPVVQPSASSNPQATNNKRKRPELSLSLSKEEIREDLIKMMGFLPPRPTYKRPKTEQRMLDAFFPGTSLPKTIKLDRYKIPRRN